jgi:hypothetical protein
LRLGVVVIPTSAAWPQSSILWVENDNMNYANNCASVSRGSDARRQIGEAAGAGDDGVASSSSRR